MATPRYAPVHVSDSDNDDSSDTEQPPPSPQQQPPQAHRGRRSKCSCIPRHASPNVNLVLLYTLLRFSTRAIWMKLLLSTYIFSLTQSTEAVGLITAVGGISELLTAPLGG